MLACRAVLHEAIGAEDAREMGNRVHRAGSSPPALAPICVQRSYDSDTSVLKSAAVSITCCVHPAFSTHYRLRVLHFAPLCFVCLMFSSCLLYSSAMKGVRARLLLRWGRRVAPRHEIGAVKAAQQQGHMCQRLADGFTVVFVQFSQPRIMILG